MSREMKFAMRIALFVILLTAFLPLCSRVVTAGQCPDKPAASVIRVGILYRSDTTEGDQMLAAVESVLNEPARDTNASLTRICIVPYPYPTEARGYRDLICGRL